MKPEFVNLIKEFCARESNDHAVAILLGVIIGGVFIWIGFIGGGAARIIILIGAGLIYYAFHLGKKIEGEDYWLDKIANSPNDIIYIKPIEVRHTVALVLTLFTNIKFKLYTVDGKELLMHCRSPEEVKTFYNLTLQHLPSAQFGYSAEVEILFDESKENFIENLKKRRLYTPILSYSIISGRS